jgi:TolA-binding protein
VLLLVGSGKYSYDYLKSDQFEQYADRTKEPMTCYAENMIGYMHIVMSHYESGYYRFSHTVNRCPGTPMAEAAEFNMARCLEGMGNNRAACDSYAAFAEKYKHSRRARIAQRASEVLHN